MGGKLSRRSAAQLYSVDSGLVWRHIRGMLQVFGGIVHQFRETSS